MMDDFKETDEFKETVEFNETYRLSSGFRVELFNINGPVYVECHDTDEAQVHILRRAANRTDLDHGRVIVEQGDEALVVRGAEEGAVINEVTLKLPRQITLVVEDISGPLSIGEVDGPVSVSSVSGQCQIARAGALKVKSVSGNVEVGQLNGGLSVFSVSGSVSAGIAGLDENGVHVKSISGPVELFFEDQVDADMNIEQVSGAIDIQLEGATRNGSEDGSSVHVVAGQGTWPVLISSVSGPVQITQRL